MAEGTAATVRPRVPSGTITDPSEIARWRKDGWLQKQHGWIKVDKRLITAQDSTAVAAAQLALALAIAGPVAKGRTEEPLYVFRALKNGKDLIAWAHSQGLTETVAADDMHVTVTYSKSPVDWLAMGEPYDKEVTVEAGGPRRLERFGPKGDVVVLVFASDALFWRNAAMRDRGASYDFPEYTPHVTLAVDVPSDRDISTIEPYQGKLEFGPETFQAIKDKWKDGVRDAIAKRAGQAGAFGKFNPHQRGKTDA